MEKIIDPIDRTILKEELNQERFLRTTRKGDNEIYSVNIHNAPNVLKEIGRLREVTFRAAGGGTGKSFDLDEFDTTDKCYDQLVVWDPEEEVLIGGYRYILCGRILDANPDNIELSTNHYFNFSDAFIRDFLPYTIELGRSFVQPEYQPGINYRKGLFALDNIWDGLGAITRNNTETKYFFGKVTMYESYNTEARNFLLHFLHHYFPDKDELITPIFALEQEYNCEEYDALLHGLDYPHGYKVLNTFVRERGEFIPPLINIYMNLSPTMKTFGTAVNREFGGVEETAILVTLEDIYQEKKDRYMTY